MKLLFIFAVMYFAIPMMTPETTNTSPHDNRSFYRTIVIDKATQEKSLNQFASSMYEKTSTAVQISKEIASAIVSIKNVEIPSMKNSIASIEAELGIREQKALRPEDTRGLAALQITCDPKAVEGEEIYDLERSVTMLYNINLIAIKDPLS